MGRRSTWQTVKMAACAVAVTVALSGMALAQYGRDDDDGYYRQGNSARARQYGYQQGYNDGVSKGRHEGREHDPYDYQTPDSASGHSRVPTLDGRSQLVPARIPEWLQQWLPLRLPECREPPW